MSNSEINVLHIYRTYFPETQGGLQEAIRQIARGLKQAGCSSSVFTLAKKPKPAVIKSPEADVYRARSVVEISSCDIGLPGAFFRFRQLAKRADILNFHYPWPFGDVLEMFANPGKPYVVTYHSDIVRQQVAEAVYGPLRGRFIAKADAIVTTSPAYARTSEFLSRSGRSVDVIPLSINVDDIPDSIPSILEQWAVRFPRPFFLFVGVLRYYKGLEFLVEAARQTGVDVVIAGDGPEREGLANRAEGARNVHFLGKIPDADKFALIRLCRAIVFPSHLRSEAFGVTLLEGAALSKPLISTEIGTGTSYVNIDGETGLVIPPANPAALAQAMRALVNDEVLACRLGEGAKARCTALFDTAKNGLKYRQLYERILSNREGTTKSRD